ncbi:sigma-54 dependent transcriptional regulator [Croceicoccus sp. F390]|uniref:DNA-binding transcriptional regulator NtrC n=1 Tax=Croceicoccus esteveae TaxID=3075597 RepID=A0ABU2ZG08_9SPHN|nr:sigma-54 dependent transcriptional regulator [Croceicoccus sp. F390]MDT0575013.1 sigma-54 dependent transcriptional regulator [Croceicoccus sp. F390]
MEQESRLLLLVDDDPAQIRMVSSIASRATWRVMHVGDGDAALSLLRQPDAPHFDALLLDSWIAGEDSCQLIGQIHALLPELAVLLLTASSSPLLAVQAMRAGAADYLIKPLAAERLLYALESSSSREADGGTLLPLSEKLDSPPDFDMMIGSAPNFRSALARAAKTARGHGLALISGEIGTGKEVLARAMHSASPRAREPLHIMHAAGMAPGHLESALYGHERGAFAGAFDRRVGALEKADGATLLIDDIEHLPLALQARLVQTIERGEIKPVGAQHGFRVDVRIICTSSAPCGELQEAGVLDPRLCGLFDPAEILLPPLRARQGDIYSLSRHFLRLIGKQPGLRTLSITDEALALLNGYSWPGNLRQLQAVLFRAAIFCDTDALSPADFPQLLNIVGADLVPSAPAAGGVTLFSADGNIRRLEDIEADVIRLAIGHYRGRMSEVARRLDIGRSTLYRKLVELGIDNAA